MMKGPSHTEGAGQPRIEGIARKMMITVIEHYVAGPCAGERVSEALNAAAFVVAEIIATTAGDPDGAVDFFNRTMQAQLRCLADHALGGRVH